MISNTSRLPLRLVATVLAAGICVSTQAAPPIHVMAHGEAVDPTVAYLILVPHVKVMGRTAGEVTGVITGRTVDGSPREYGIDLPCDRPTVVRVAPGRYAFTGFEVGSRGTLQLEEDRSLFDAKPGQFNYPGDWSFSLDRKDILRNAQTIGWRFEIELWTHEERVDLSKLDVDADFIAGMKAVYTRLEPRERRAVDGG